MVVYKQRKNIFEIIYAGMYRPFVPIIVSKTNLSPNKITIISGLFGIIGAVLLIFQYTLFLVLAAICIQIFAILDLVDGDVARLKNMQSQFGQWLDIFFDKLNDFLIILCLSIGCYIRTLETMTLVLGMLLMGFVFAIQMLMVMNNHIFNLGKQLPTADSNEGKEEIYESKGNNSSLLPKSIISFVMTHMTLGHSSFLFLISLFALTNMPNFALRFLVMHAAVTLSLMVIINFYRLRNGSQHHYN